ncbi:MAG: hypothetical protein PCALPYG88_7228 [uncultured Paraburkholderia sp.]|nr:MAG: hypothetical protein PCALPYG08_7240 [uncultured Paraburkholderia sp.]CAH2942526.1 MAG: hypothetical protein PCALPYG88_7228 [uncultured Paraburkholderia sp.]
MTVCARVHQRVVPAAMLAVVILLAPRIELLAHVVRLPSCRRPIEQIAQQFPMGGDNYLGRSLTIALAGGEES